MNPTAIEKREPQVRRAARVNPFNSRSAVANSSYDAFADGKLVRPFGGVVTAVEEFVHDSFRSLVLNPKFACVAAKSAIRSGNYRFANYPELGAGEVVEGVARDLFAFVQEQGLFEGFSSFVATFQNPATMSEEEFEARLWQTLQALHDLDSSHSEWDSSVSSDPADPAFSFSFAGRAFFIVGLHPGSSRLTRRFAFPTLVFNAHDQFEALRSEGKFDRVKEVIRARDMILQGSLNANLSDFGERSDATQYSGRPVEPGWRCPFH